MQKKTVHAMYSNWAKATSNIFYVPTALYIDVQKYTA